MAAAAARVGELVADPLDRMGLWFDADAKPISLRQWATLLGDDRYKILAQTWITDDIQVSTVWLGLDYGHVRYLPGHEDDPPLIFETMVFVRPFGHAADDVIERDGTECYHWPTREIALAGHMRIVAELRGGITVQTEPEAESVE